MTTPEDIKTVLDLITSFIKLVQAISDYFKKDKPAKKKR